MSNLSDLLPAGAGAKVITATADGNLATGQTVILQSDATVKAVAESTVSPTLPIGTLQTASTLGEGEYLDVKADPNNSNRWIYAYKDNAGKDVYVRVYTLSGTTWTASPEQQIYNGSSTEMVGVSWLPDTEGKFIVCYDNQSSEERARVGTVSGSAGSESFTLGTEQTISNNSWSYPFGSKTLSVEALGSSGSVIVSSRQGSNYPAARVLSVSGTTVTAGSETIIYSGSTSTGTRSAVNPGDATDVVFTYRRSNKIQCASLAISGTSITVTNNEQTMDSSENQEDFWTISPHSGDTSSFKFVVCSANTSNARPALHINSVDSSGTFTFGSKQEATTSTASDVAADTGGRLSGGDPDTVIIVFDKNADSDYYGIVGTISGTTATFGSEAALVSSVTLQYQFQNVAKQSDSNGSFMAIYRKTPTSYPQFIGGYAGGTTTSLTATNFVGITNQAINNSASGEVVVEGGVITNGSLLPLAYTGSLGSEATYESAQAEYQGIAYDSSNNRVVVAYKDDGNSSYGTCAVGTVSGTSISWGTPVVFAAASTSYVDCVFDSSNNKIVIVYSDVGNSEYGTAIVGTVSGTSISFGSEVVFASAATTYIGATFDSNSNKVVAGYRDDGNSQYFTTIVGTVSGTSISFGTEVVVDSTGSLSGAWGTPGAITFDSTNNKVVIPYTISGGSTYGIVGTVSGTSISYGTRVAISGVGGQNLAATFDSNAGKVVINFRDSNASDASFAVVATVSGTSISFGSPQKYSDTTYTHPTITFDSNSNVIVIAALNNTSPYDGEYIIGIVSGDTISFNSPVQYNSSYATYNVSTFDSGQNTVVIAYKDGGDSNYGRARGLQITGAVPNLTIGSTYYVQNDGTLSTTSSSVTAGKAIANTTLLLNG